MTDCGNTSFGNLNDPSSPEGDDIEGATSESSPLAVARKPQTSTRVSLLVEALVHSVVSAYETDSKKATNAYKKICRRLFQMGLIDESWGMAELEGARVQFEHALFQLLDGGPSRAPSPILIQGAYYTSQYKREFDEFEKIGGGAFGKVFRVKHKLDGTEYAVKKIPLHSEGIESVKNYLSEVKTFAKLNHPNIVQYKAAWLELGTPTDVKSVRNSMWNQSKLVIPGKTVTEQLVFHDEMSDSFTNDGVDRSSNFEIEFEHSSDDSHLQTENGSSFKSSYFHDQSELSTAVMSGPSIFHSEISSISLNNDNSASNSKFEIAFEHSQGNSLTNGKSSTSKIFSPTEKAIVPSHHNHSSVPKVHWATLYIQMALCHCTLDQWLRKRHEKFNVEMAVMPSNVQGIRTKAIQQILIQILRGLEYIHSKGVVHHDIKPSNIFVSAEGSSLLVQLGDFGLACPLQRARHGFARGTPLYAAPEQLTGRCDPKSDMYSVGIVLFELLEDFGTAMERTRRISELRARSNPPIPLDFSLANLVSALVRRCPSERPDASALLQKLESSVRPDVELLEERLAEKEREIQRLKELLRKHGVQGV